MTSEVNRANKEIHRVYNNKRSNGINTTIDRCREEYSKLMNNSNWSTYLEHLKSVDKANGICSKCYNIPLFNSLSVCVKCNKRYDSNGEELK